jgi:hypothetical protein
MRSYIVFAMTIVACAIVVSSNVSAQQCATPLAEPPVPSYSIGIDSDPTKALFWFNLTISDAFDEDIVVSFPDSSVSGYCDFTITDISANPLWNDGGSVDCNSTYRLSIPVRDLLGNCGFVQDNEREAGKTHFLNTAIVSTAQNRTNLRFPYTATRSYQFYIDISIANTVSATIGDIQVFGNAITYNLLGDLEIVPVDNGEGGYTYVVSGDLITSVQWPYVLTYNSTGLDDDFNSSTFGWDLDTGCNAADGHPADTPCQQKWNFSFSINSDVACITKEALVEDLLRFNFDITCSDVYQSECAPAFSISPAIETLISSPDFCPQTEELGINADIQLYAYQGFGVPSDGLFYSTASDVPPLTFGVEDTFTFDSHVYGEIRGFVDGNAATLATTKILLLITKAEGFASKTIYDNTGSSAQFAPSVIVRDSGFGATGTYDDSRARFEFKWSEDTLNRNNADNAVTTTITGVIEVTFVEGQALVRSQNPVMQSLVDEVHAKSKRVLSEAISAKELRAESNAAVTAAPTGVVGEAASPSALTADTMMFGVAVIGTVLLSLLALVGYRQRQRTNRQKNREERRRQRMLELQALSGNPMQAQPQPQPLGVVAEGPLALENGDMNAAPKDGLMPGIRRSSSMPVGMFAPDYSMSETGDYSVSETHGADGFEMMIHQNALSLQAIQQQYMAQQEVAEDAAPSGRRGRERGRSRSRGRHSSRRSSRRRSRNSQVSESIEDSRLDDVDEADEPYSDTELSMMETYEHSPSSQRRHIRDSRRSQRRRSRRSSRRSHDDLDIDRRQRRHSYAAQQFPMAGMAPMAYDPHTAAMMQAQIQAQVQAQIQAQIQAQAHVQAQMQANASAHVQAQAQAQAQAQMQMLQMQLHAQQQAMAIAHAHAAHGNGMAQTPGRRNSLPSLPSLHSHMQTYDDDSTYSNEGSEYSVSQGDGEMLSTYEVSFLDTSPQNE